MGRLLPEDADAYEPYSTRRPLPPSRNRDVPPDKYLVPYCVRQNEGDARYSCPHLGCDGLSFYTARECHAHEDRYHAGPYRCSTCEQLFAAQSALERHCLESGHGIWVCATPGCDMEGVCFGDEREFEKHVRESWAHKDAGTDEDALSECVSAVGEICLAQACHKFEKFFASAAEWERHAASLGHVRAVSLFEAFSRLEMSAEDLAAKLEGARSLRCDKSDCRRFGTVMSTAQAYFHHLDTEDHKDPEGMRAKKAEKRVRMACGEPECARFGFKYQPSAYARHVESVSHVMAVRIGEAERKLADLPPSTPGSETQMVTESAGVVGLPTPTESPTEGAFEGPPTRFTTPTRRIAERRGDESGDSPLSPGSPGTGSRSPAPTVREMWLRKRNRELELRNWELEDKIETLKKMAREMRGPRRPCRS